MDINNQRINNFLEEVLDKSEVPVMQDLISLLPEDKKTSLISTLEEADNKNEQLRLEAIEIFKSTFSEIVNDINSSQELSDEEKQEQHKQALQALSIYVDILEGKLQIEN